MEERDPEASASTSYNMVKDLFDEFMTVRNALISALTQYSDDVYEQCKRAQGNACLRGLSDGTWVVRVHRKTTTIPKVPKPTFGINFTDGMDKDQWLHLVAKHSDSWLFAAASFKASESQFPPAERMLLYCKMARIPSIAERVQHYIAKAKKKNKRVLDVSGSASASTSRDTCVPPKKRRQF